MSERKARTPRVGERYVVPDWILDRELWHDAMDEVLSMLKIPIPSKQTPQLPPIRIVRG